MPDLKTRNQHEDALAAALLLIFNDWHDRWIAFGRLEGLDAAVAGAALPTLAQVHGEAAGNLASLQSFPLSAGEANQKGVGWARQRAAELGRQIVESTEKAIEDEESLEKVFGAERTVMIAITEVTRAITVGELWVLLLLMTEAGLVFGVFWYTEADERVCPVCAPLHATEREFWQQSIPEGPPAHPRCRCHLTFKEVSNG
ncbi:hypothetical protein LCGC14_0325820 [marine sediment metagenome]|uniref:Phage head morphogenesis domain-containing protein n=1 Tax=marine sediment metagenome TaxID=412755 RepID=A0A0F9W549_9ZZZZ